MSKLTNLDVPADYETLADTNTTVYRPSTNLTVELSKLNAQWAHLYDRHHSLLSDIERSKQDIASKEKQVLEIEEKLSGLREKIVNTLGGGDVA